MTQNKVVDTCIILVNISQEHQLRLSVYYNYKLTKICKYSIKNKHVQFRSTAQFCVIIININEVVKFVNILQVEFYYTKSLLFLF